MVTKWKLLSPISTITVRRTSRPMSLFSTVQWRIPLGNVRTGGQRSGNLGTRLGTQVTMTSLFVKMQ